MQNRMQAVGASEREEEVLCTCFSITRGDLQRVIAGEPDINFEVLLARTNAGRRCTACMMDLEHFFSTNAGAPAVLRGTARASRAAVGVDDRLSLKQRLYKLIDGMSPMAPFRLVNPCPVLAGPGLEQSVAVTNDSLLYEGETVGPPLKLGLAVRDSHGAIRHRGRHRIAAGQQLLFNVSRFLEGPDSTPVGSVPAIGSVEISRVFEAVGSRGTTRPQIAIDAPGGTCAVHSQGPTLSNRLNWFTCFHRPGEERGFVSVVNVDPRPLRGRIAYPFGIEGLAPIEHEIVVPAHGAWLHEIGMPVVAAACLGDRPLELNLLFDGRHKAHFLCATPDLDRFSIDHL